MRLYISTVIVTLCNVLTTNSQEHINNLKIIDSLYKNEAYKEVIKYSSHILDLSANEHKAYYLNKIAKSFYNLNQEDSAFFYHKKELKIYKSLDLKEKTTLTNYDIYNLLSSQNNLNIDNKPYFEAIKQYATKVESKKWSAVINHQLGIKNYFEDKIDSSKYYFLKSLKQFRAIDSIKMEIQLLCDLGSLYSRKFAKQDSAIYFYNKAIEIHQNDSIEKKNLQAKFYIYNNIGNVYRRKKEYSKALEYYKYVEPLELKKLNLNSKKILYSNIEATYYYMNDFENAYYYLYNYDSIEKIIDVAKQNSNITDIEEKYNNEKLRANALELESKRKTNRNLLIASLALLLFGGITAFLINKNVKRKQLLAEQGKELQIQKVTTLLKEQELTAIDAMIEGQEKERQIIANDLHDDLGGLMATIKLHFDALQKKQSPEMFKKTNNLLEEAYQKIRGIAHAKNSGVLASQGLLKAINHMANKISNTNNLRIEVIDYGLENRLENSLELTIFRIIQELITNTIKHADATEISIQITNHDYKLNIVVEDNGKGFNVKTISKQTGMGIHSIDKRIENLNGNVHIDSKVGQGTSVIIDIPT